MSKLLLRAALLLAPLFLWTGTSSAAVFFSGGDGSPLTITVTSPLVFTGVPDGQFPYGIVFQNAVLGNGTPSNDSHAGTATFASAAGTSSGVGGMGSVSFGVFTLNDIFVFFNVPATDIVATTAPSETFLVGTRTTDNPLALDVSPVANFAGTARLFIQQCGLYLCPSDNRGDSRAIRRSIDCHWIDRPWRPAEKTPCAPRLASLILRPARSRASTKWRVGLNSSPSSLLSD